MSVPIPFKMNLTTPAGLDVTGYVKFTGDLYSAGVGYGFESAVDGAAFRRGVNPDEKHDTGWFTSSAGDSDLLRIDLPTGRVYEVVVMMGDPAAGLSNAQLIISDNGANTLTVAGLDTLANEFAAVGHRLKVDSFLRLQIGKAVGGPFYTAVNFIHIYEEAERKAVFSSLTPRGSKRVP